MKEVLSPNTLANCDSLSLMERLPSASVDLVYLDPPWSNDAYTFAVEYEILVSKLFQQANRVLNQTGKIVIHSIVNQNVFFHAQASALFGQDHYLEEFIIPRKGVTGNSHETLIVYSKTDSTFFNKRVRKVSEQELKEKFPSQDENGSFMTIMLTMPVDRSNYQFNWRGITPPKGQSWKYSLEKLNDFLLAGLISFRKGIPYEKRYLSDKDYIVEIPTVWNDLSSSPDDRDFKFTIPLSGFERLLEYSTRPNDVVLIPICYRGRMIDACEKLNRKWIAGSEPSSGSDELIERILQKGVISNILNSDNLNSYSVVWNAYKYKSNQFENYILELISQGEDDTIEFKESICWNHHTQQKDTNAIEKIIKSIVAFLNSPIGGKIIVGVDDDGNIVGIENDIEVADPRKKNADGYKLYLTNSIADKLNNNASLKCQIGIYELEKKKICLITVNHSNDPVFYNGDFYIRTGNESRKISGEEVYNHLIRRGLNS
ncbi:MAG: putative DNA binding domain-containing protein [Saprospiraceae bacterium]|nr:putative DNA binding domain-containing protein [Saprospiraceae bacterium]